MPLLVTGAPGSELEAVAEAIACLDPFRVRVRGREGPSELDDVDQAGVRNAGQHGQRGQRPEQSAAAISGAADHHRGPQDHPVEAALLERRIAFLLAARESGGAAAVDPDRRDLHHAPDPGLFAGAPQGRGRVAMHARERIAQAVLERAGAVHHRVEAREIREPVLGAQHRPQVETQPAGDRHAAGSGIDIAGDAGHLVPLGAKPRGLRRFARDDSRSDVPGARGPRDADQLREVATKGRAAD